MAYDKYDSDDDRPHVDSDTCAKCRKKLTRGHRIMMINIVHQAGVDLRDLGRKGLYLWEDYEFGHVDCNDPYLKKGLGDGRRDI